MNTKTNNRIMNQNALDYAIYMMLGSYYRSAVPASKRYLDRMYLYYSELKMDKQFALENKVINFTEQILLHKLPEQLWQDTVVVHFYKAGDKSFVFFKGERYILRIEGKYRGKNIKLRCSCWEKKAI